MKYTNFFESDDIKRIICLGRFDGVHLGHRSIILQASKLKQKFGNDIILSVFAFRRVDEAGNRNRIYTFDENCDLIQSLSVDEVLYADETERFFNTTKSEFLNLLFKSHNPVAVVCGEDYTFGKDREGNVGYLREYCAEQNVFFLSLPILRENGKKVSSTLIKEDLLAGNVEEANTLLGSRYHITGTVLHGRSVGHTIGFPTLNVAISPLKCPVKTGVYSTLTTVDGKVYKSLTNYGSAPTFGQTEILAESYLLDFSEDIYGKTVKTEFVGFIRDDVKFDTVSDLITQLKKDVKNL